MKRFTAILIGFHLLLFLNAQIEFEKETSMLPQNGGVTQTIDFNHDGYIDLITHDWAESKITVLINDKNGGFSIFQTIEKIYLDFLWSDLVVGDFDNDTFDDLLLIYTKVDSCRRFEVFKNFNGDSLVSFFQEDNVDVNFKDLQGNNWQFFDFDLDNDLDIVSGKRIFRFNNKKFEEVDSLINMNDFHYSYYGVRNNICLGQVVPELRGTLITSMLNTNMGSSGNIFLNDLQNNTLEFIGSLRPPQNLKNRGMSYYDLNKDNILDIITLSIEDSISLKFNLNIRKSIQSSQTTSKSLSSKMMNTTKLKKNEQVSLAWDIVDIDNDGFIDIVYHFNDSIYECGVISTKDYENNYETYPIIIDTQFNNYENKGTSLNIADINNDGKIDFITSNTIYIQKSENIKPLKELKAPIQDSINSDLWYLFGLFWEDKNEYPFSTEHIITKNRKGIFDMVLNSTNHTHNKRREINTRPVKRLTLKEDGWYFYTIRSVNDQLACSEWAEIDSFYFKTRYIFGEKNPCSNSTLKYEVRVNYRIDEVIWETKGNNEIKYDPRLLSCNITWNSFGTDTIITYTKFHDNIIDTIELICNIGQSAGINVDYPDIVCNKEEITLKNTGEKIDNELFSWTFYSKNGIIEEINGVDSLKFKIPDDIDSLFFEINISSTENNCATNYIPSGKTNNLIKVIGTRTFNLLTDDFLCGNKRAVIKVDETRFPESVFNWDFEDADIIENLGDSLITLQWSDFGQKQVTLFVNEYGCSSDTSFAFIELKPFPKIHINYTDFVCHNENGFANFTGNLTNQASFNWNFDNADIVIGEGAGPYNLTWNTGGIKNLSLLIDDGGCVADTNFIVEISEPAAMQPLNGVSVNAKNHAVIMWDSPAVNIDSVILYKESEQSNVYKRIAALKASEATTFADTTTDCSSQPYRFKLAVVDTCGYKSEMSDYHKTMHLMLNKGLNNSWNLVWSDYEGLEVGTYSIYRGSNPEAMYKIADVSGNVYTFTDQNPPIGDLYYAIVASNISNKSTSLKSALSDPAKIQSNMVETRIFNAIPHNFAQKWFNINVNNKILRIESLQQSQYSFSVNDLTGKRLFISSKNSGHSVYNMSYMPEGVYILIIDVDNKQQMFKIKL